MGKVFRPSTRESAILSKIESLKEHSRRAAINSIKECMEPLCNAIATKLVEERIVETSSKDSLEEQIRWCLEKLIRSDDFEVDYQIAPVRNIVPQPHIISLYLTAFVTEQLVNHKDIVDVFGSNEDIYLCINKQVTRFIS